MEKAGQAIPQDLKDAEAEKGGSSGWGKEDSWDKKDDSWDKEEGKWWEKKDEKKDDDEWWKKDEKAEDKWWEKKADDGADAVTPGSLIGSLLGGKRPADEAEDAPPEKAART